MIDVGTGAGFPTIPLKIARPDLRISALDSVRKKLTFLGAAASALGIAEVELVHGRAEDLGRAPAYRERFDFAVSRAVSKLSVLAELCMPFCRIGGKFIAYKGPDIGREVQDAEKAFGLLGGELESTHTLGLPHTDLTRTLVIVRKTRLAPGKYPRKAGVPGRTPL
jgi:16S rRNA (guanine527-N7)-methyltransferase